MITVRRVRYSHYIGSVPLAELSRALAGAGTRVLAAADARDDRAFARMADEWAPFFDGGHLRLDERPAEAQAVIVTWADDSDRREAETVANLAAPAGEAWEIRTMRYEKPERVAFDLDAFTAPHDVAPGPGLSLGTLTINP